MRRINMFSGKLSGWIIFLVFFSVGGVFADTTGGVILFVDSYPSGAVIALDGKFLGKTPCEIQRETKDVFEIEVTGSGSGFAEIRIDPGKGDAILINLYTREVSYSERNEAKQQLALPTSFTPTPIPHHPKVINNTPIPLQPMNPAEVDVDNLIQPKPWYKRWYTWALGLGLVGGGAAAASSGGGGSSPEPTATPAHYPGQVETQFQAPGPAPRGIAWDGSDLWNTDSETDLVYHLNSAGEMLGSFSAPGTSPQGIVWANAFFWLVDSDSRKIFKITHSGIVVTSFASPGDFPRGIDSDGENLWVSDIQSRMIYKVSFSGEVLSSFQAPGTAPTGIAWDGRNIWHSDLDTGMIYKLTQSGAVMISFSAPGNFPVGLSAAGDYLWNVDSDTRQIYKIYSGAAGEKSASSKSRKAPGLLPNLHLFDSRSDELRSKDEKIRTFCSPVQPGTRDVTAPR